MIKSADAKASRAIAPAKQRMRINIDSQYLPDSPCNDHTPPPAIDLFLALLRADSSDRQPAGKEIKQQITNQSKAPRVNRCQGNRWMDLDDR